MVVQIKMLIFALPVNVKKKHPQGSKADSRIGNPDLSLFLRGLFSFL
jgi:hypothetical protein